MRHLLLFFVPRLSPTIRADPPKVTLIHLDDRSPTSLTLSWALSRRPPAHISHRYELMYRRKVRPSAFYEIPSLGLLLRVFPGKTILILMRLFDLLKDGDGERDVTTYTVLILDKNAVHVNDLTPDTTYLFRVQALSSEGNPGSYSAEYEFRTFPLGNTQLAQLL